MISLDTAYEREKIPQNPEKDSGKTGLKEKLKKFKRIKWFAKRGPLDVTFLTLVLLLMAFGLVMLFSASYFYAYNYYGNSYYFIAKQAGFAAIGIALMLFVSNIDYHFIRKFALPFYLVMVAFLILS